MSKKQKQLAMVLINAKNKYVMDKACMQEYKCSGFFISTSGNIVMFNEENGI